MVQIRAALTGFLVGAGVVAGGWPARAQAPTEIDREFEFASRLVEDNFADYAERLVDELLRLNPGEKERAKMVQIEIMAARRKFDQAEELLKSMPAASPKAQAARLSVANYAYRFSDIDRAKRLYVDFFKQYGTQVPSDPDLKRVYMDSAYRFGQLLETAGDLAAAGDAYEKVLKCKPDPGISRRIRFELANLLVRAAKKEGDEGKKKAHLNRAFKLCEELQWDREGGMDVAFGHSIMTMANIEIMRGNPAAAQKLIRQNLDIMTGLDDILKEEGQLAASPLASARFLLAELYEKEAASTKDEQKKVLLIKEAAQHYINVFAKYGDSDWGPEAGLRGEKLIAKLGQMGVTVKPIDFKAHARKAVEAQVRQADVMYGQKNYTEAARLYSRILNMFPDAPAAPQWTNLLLCWAHLNRPRELDAGAWEIAERAGRTDPQAGLALLAVAKHFFDAKDEKTCIVFYETFVEGFPKHEKTPSVLYTLSGMLDRAGQKADAQKYLDLLVKNFPRDQYYLKSLHRIGWAKYEAKDYAGAAEVFAKYIQDSPPQHQRAIVQATLADCYMRLDQFDRAVKEYRTLASWVEAKEGNPYATTGDEVKKVDELREKCQFFIGYGLSRVAEPADAVPKLRQAAIETLARFLAAYPASDLAPKAMNVIGTIHLELGQTEAASTTFNDLQKKYPNSEDGKSARYSLIMAAVKIKKFDIALEAFEKMMASEPADQPSKTFTPDQLVRVAQAFFDAGRDGEAAAAFRKVLASKTEDRAILERTLYGLGMSAYRTQKFEEAIRNLDDMLQRYPKSGLFYDARLTLGRAYRDAGKLPEAVAELTDVFKFASDPATRDTANIELGTIQYEAYRRAKEAGRAGEADDAMKAALASYERVVLLGDEKGAATRPLVEQAFLRVIPLYEEAGRFEKVVEKCEAYVAKFPESPKLAEIRRKMSDARMKAATATPPSAPGPAGGAAGGASR